MKSLIFSAQIVILLVSYHSSLDVKATGNSANKATDSRIPVIAIISQPATTYQRQFPDGGQSFSEVVGSYVDWVEQTGAEAALVPFDMPWHVLIKVLSHTQALVLPGGAAELVEVDKANKTTEYMDRIHKIIEWAKLRNKKHYYPVWGTCLGFEEAVISFAGNNGKSLLNGFDDKGKFHEVNLKPTFWKSKFFGNLDISKKKIKSVFGKPISYYFHSEGISIEHFNKFSGLKNDVNIQGTSKNDAGQEFIAILEAKKFPIFFVQFHPEKHQFEKRKSYKDLDRSYDTIKLMTSFIFKVVNDVRQNAVKYEEIPMFVQSFFPYYKVPIWSPVQSFERIYIFKNYFTLPGEEDTAKKGKLRLLATTKKRQERTATARRIERKIKRVARSLRKKL